MIEILSNDVTPDGMRRVKVVSDAALDVRKISPSPFPLPLGEECARRWTDELLGLNYLEATWPCREALKIRGEGWKVERAMVLWKLKTGDTVREGFRDAFAMFCERFKSFPDYAFMRKLPKTIENGFEVADVMFLEAEWVPAGCIAVGKGESYGSEAMAL